MIRDGIEYNDVIKRKTLELKEAILQSDEYLRFMECKRILEQDPELYDFVCKFRTSNFQLQVSGEVADEAKSSALLEEYMDTLGITKVTDYMNAELLLCQRLHDMNETLMEEIDLDLRF